AGRVSSGRIASQSRRASDARRDRPALRLGERLHSEIARRAAGFSEPRGPSGCYHRRTMRLVKIAVASVDSTVGAVRSNADRCIALAHEMARDDCTLAVFPEQVIGGYPMEDLVQWRGFVASQRRELVRFAAETAGLATVFA